MSIDRIEPNPKDDYSRQIDKQKAEEMMKVTEQQRAAAQEMFKVNDFNRPTLK